MPSTYYLMDTAHADYDSYLADLEEVSASNFTPRLSLDETKALVQMKSNVDLSFYSGIDWIESPSACILGSGDQDWACDLAQGSDWDESEE